MASTLKPLSKPTQSAIAFLERYGDSLDAIEPSEPCFLHFVNVCLGMLEDVKVPEKAPYSAMLSKVLNLSAHAERTCAVTWAQYVYAVIMMIPNKVIGGDKAVRYFADSLSSIIEHINYQCANAITSPEDMQRIEDATLRLVAVLIGSLVDDGKVVTCVQVIPEDGDLSAVDGMLPDAEVDECLALARDIFGWREAFIADSTQCVQLCGRFNEIGKEIDKNITMRFMIPPRSQCDPEDWHVLDVLKLGMLLFFTNALAWGYITSPDECLSWWRRCLVKLMTFQDPLSDEDGSAVLQDGGVDMRHIADVMIGALDSKYTSHVTAFKTNLLLLLSQLGDDGSSSAAVSLANMLDGQDFDNMRQIAEEWYQLFKPIANRCNLVASLHSHALETMQMIEDGKYEDEIGVRHVTTLDQIKANDPERMTSLIRMISDKFPSILSPIKLPSVIAQRENLAVRDVRSIWRFSYSTDDTREEIANKADAMLSCSTGDYEAYVSALQVLQTCIKEAARAHISAADITAKRLIERIGSTSSDKVNVNNIGAILPNLLTQMASGIPEMQQDDAVLSARTAYLLSYVVNSEAFSTNVVRLLWNKNIHPAQAARMAKYAMRSAESTEQESVAASGIPSISQLVYARDDNPLLISDDEEEANDGDDIF